ncbi:glycosyltransferase family 2 protein [Formosa algae]|uniref:Glycosyltransferase involved in cell wall biosynthesis n=1 Tax=Formosa algae TaxID=225843 RepID=A0A9X0YJ74_9FLAO|nr:glycosyltransferase family 2 protein [Formosa algae]MBP1839516.1 glycosyltransferase involved in cell wall biosynthesis [Formosa algae]MDQ0334820.1 glycosyltransferase involved in cell wall biosynthesis [Formosa algae]OEI82064.1 dolichol-P-glucose synthetase [Formosa algae]
MNIELTVVMPCLNEAETLAICIKKAQAFFTAENIAGEIIIADNGSTDGSIQIAEQLQAQVVHVKEKGYGSALKGGIETANGTYIIMADADNSYDFSTLLPFIVQLRAGYDLVVGNRFKGGIKTGAMPFLHKYLGNPVLSFIGKLFYKIEIGDFHCGLRGFTKAAFLKMDLKTSGMEFASEMIVKAKLKKLKITEVPTILHPDGRSRKPHLNTWSDGWRHLRFLSLYSPNWLFLYPALVLMIIGIVSSTLLIIHPIQIKNVVLDVHTLLYTSSFVLIGFQFLVFYCLTKIYAVENDLLPKSNRYDKLFKYINLERGLVLGVLILIIGCILSYYGVFIWKSKDFGNLNPTNTLRIVIPAVFTILLGIQVILFSLFFSILGLKNNK